MNIRNVKVTGAAVALAVWAVACTPKAASLEIDPATVEINSAGGTKALKVIAKDDKGGDIANPKLTFTSVDAGIAEVDLAGTVTAKRSGKTQIAVAAGEVVVNVPVSVAIYTSLKPGADSLELTVGETALVQAKILDENGQPLSGTVEWKAADPAMLKVDPRGTVTALVPGDSKLTATAGPLSADVTVKVTPKVVTSLRMAAEAIEVAVGQTQTLATIAVDRAGTPMQDVVYTWSSNDPAKASVDTNGTVTGIAPGVVEITAMDPASGLSAVTKVTVKPAG